MSQTTPAAAADDDPAATLGVPTTATDPEQLSAHLAQDAINAVHAQPDVPVKATAQAHRDPTIPGANYVDLREATPSDAPPSSAGEPTHPRYWVGLAGEVLPAEVDEPRPGPNPELQQARLRYSAAVEAVRLRYRVPLSTDLFAVPDTYVPGAHFVHDTAPDPVVRWVDPTGQVHDGYQLRHGAPQWDTATVTARHEILAAQPATAALLTSAASAKK